MTRNFAHRGYSSRYPENTLLAFQKAVEAKADGIELDVQLSRDGVPVIIHNETLQGTTNGTGYVKDYTLRQLKELDASGKFSGVYGTNPIPTLREYFELIEPTDLITDIELKTAEVAYPGIEEKVLDLIDEYALRDRVVMSSFCHETMEHFKELAPYIPCGLLVDRPMRSLPEYAVRRSMDTINPGTDLVTSSLVREAHARGLLVYVWTVNEEEEMLRLLDLGVDALIGDCPGLCRQVILGYKMKKK